MSLAYTAKGKVLRVDGDVIVFRPANSTYELYLSCPRYAGPLEEPVELILRAQARKAYTVASGGLFTSPIAGMPKILQGRVTDLTDDRITLNAGVVFNITLPIDMPGAIELANGPIAQNALVNVVLMASASAEWVKPST